MERAAISARASNTFDAAIAHYTSSNPDLPIDQLPKP